jgi:hypothetical protein
VVMTEVSRSMDAMGVLSLREDRRECRAVITTILSVSSDIFLVRSVKMVRKRPLLLNVWFCGGTVTMIERSIKSYRIRWRPMVIIGTILRESGLLIRDSILSSLDHMGTSLMCQR